MACGKTSYKPNVFGRYYQHHPFGGQAEACLVNISFAAQAIHVISKRFMSANVSGNRRLQSLKWAIRKVN
ncbi:hypothetical protein Y032_0005g2567 [Ancylostoma ceylanicum]|uniref:Uncharacterized protein n=1 Tax=Ancylostoma ceylanicum TaxID=53326 RepID=A0A016VU49_9BILA|nr:hypothetical protein Y032_0005g2567 [Ancylostoma ceylanicum]